MRRPQSLPGSEISRRHRPRLIRASPEAGVSQCQDLQGPGRDRLTYLNPATRPEIGTHRLRYRGALPFHNECRGWLKMSSGHYLSFRMSFLQLLVMCGVSLPDFDRLLP